MERRTKPIEEMVGERKSFGNRLEQGFPDDSIFTQVRAEEDRIIVICGTLPEDRPPGTRTG
jgi:hypothetical protein